jgi:Chaperone of endosialidase
MAVPYTFGNATTSIPLSQLDSNFATAITIGNTAVYLGNTTTSFGNVTLTNVTISSGNATVTKITAPTHDAGSGNALTLQSNSTTGLYIDASQNVGIGTTSPAYKLDVSQNTSGGTSIQIQNPNATANSNAGYIARTNNGNEYIQLIGYAQASGYLQFNNATGGVVETVNSQPLAFWTNSTERMRIDSSGNVGIGTTSMSTALQVGSTSKTSDSTIYTSTGNGSYKAGLIYEVSSQNAGFVGFNKTGSTYLGIPDSTSGFSTSSSIPIVFATTGSERMRIDSSGNLLVGLTSGGGSKLEVSASQEVARFWNTGGTGNIRFVNSGGSTIGYIQWSGSSTSYVTSSDYRLKENVTPMTTGLEKISALKPVNYDWISDKSQGEGFIAHELQAVIPAAVTGEKDAVNEDGSIKPQGVDYSKIVVHLVAALQELKAEFDAYKATHP